MKRVFALILLFSALFVCLGLAGCGATQSCTCKSTGGRFYGLCDNGCFSVPNMIGSVCNTLTCGDCGERGEYVTRELTAKDVSFEEVTLCENSLGTGANGYVIVNVYGKIQYEGYSPDIYLDYISFCISAYDEGIFVGKTTVVRTKDDLAVKNLVQESIGMEVDDYYSGNYTFEISDVSGRYATYDYAS